MKRVVFTRISKAVVIFVAVFFFNSAVAIRAAEIHEAAKSGDISKIKELIEGNPQLLNLKDEIGRTPLHWACRGGGHEKAAEYLINEGADVNIRDNNNVVTLHSVAINGLKHIAALLIKKDADINVQSRSGYTPLHYAAHYGQLEIAHLLVENGADVNIRNRYGRTPLIHAAREGGNAEIADLLISHGADVNVKDNEGWTPLDFAVLRGHKEVVRVLVKNGAIVTIKDQEGMETIHRAAMGGHMELVHLLIKKGADVKSRNMNGGTLLHSAAAGDLKDLISSLKSEDFDPNEVNRYSLTPLHMAAMKGHTEIVELLIQRGANIDVKSLDGKTPLYMAQEEGHDEAAEILIANGADTSVLNFTNLHGKYFNQQRPGLDPELFAPGIVSTVFADHCSPVFSPDGKEVYFYPISGKGTVFMELKGRRWTIPRTAFFSDEYAAVNPAFSPDGNRIYFKSQRPLEENGTPGPRRVWYVQKEKKGWSEPKPFEKTLNLEGVGWQVSVASNNNLYFTCSSLGEGVYRFPFTDGDYSDPEKVDTEFSGTDPAVAPDESYLIFVCTDRDDGFGGDDLYISFQKKDGTWTKAKNMGNRVNASSHELWPSVSSDGKYIFFVSFRNGNADVYWINAKIIEDLKPKESK